MTDEKNLVSVTIHVDVSGGIQLAHTCARCGATAQSVPTSYDCMNPHTGQTDSKVFIVRSAMPPEGWEHLRMTDPEKTWHLEVCPTCIRKFFLEKKP
jgi:hypothetical protein